MSRVLALCLGLLVFVAAAHAAALRVGTLNCFLLFDPAIDHRGKVDDQNRLTTEQYESKLGNLASMMAGFDVIALQETGGRAEIEALAGAGQMRWAFTKGTDTYTGQEVGLLYRDLPGWRFTRKGRMAALSSLSKHLVVSAEGHGHRVHFLVVHMIRPFGRNLEKHERQIAAISGWIGELRQLEPSSVVVVLGDTNNTGTRTDQSLFGVGQEAGWFTTPAFAPTHLNGKHLDRIVLIGDGRASFGQVSVLRPPYPKRPNDTLVRIWTDHFLLSAELRL